MNTPSNNTVHCIAPYRHPQSKSVWVFDDPRHGLQQEPFVGSANLPFDAVDAQLNAGGKLTAYFSTTPLPKSNLTLTAAGKREGARSNGCTYSSTGSAGNYEGMQEIWLCPALMHYFSGDDAPEKIYARIEARI